MLKSLSSSHVRNMQYVTVTAGRCVHEHRCHMDMDTHMDTKRMRNKVIKRNL